MRGNVDVDISTDDDLAAVHEGAEIAPGITRDNDLPAGHAAPVPTVCSAEVVAGIALDEELAALHPGPGKGVNVPVHRDPAALHPCTDVHVGVAVHNDLACGHLHADVLDPREIPVDDDLRLFRGRPGPAGYLEEVSELVLLPPDVDREDCDLLRLLPGERIGSDAVSLEVQPGLVLYGECNGFHPSLHLTLWRQPQSRTGSGGSGVP